MKRGVCISGHVPLRYVYSPLLVLSLWGKYEIYEKVLLYRYLLADTCSIQEKCGMITTAEKSAAAMQLKTIDGGHDMLELKTSVFRCLTRSPEMQKKREF